MTNEQPTDSLADLAAGFADKSRQQQEGTDDEQDQDQGSGDPKPDSREPDGTDPSRPDADPAKLDLENLTIEQIKAHPTLSKLFQSEADRAAAAQLAGKTREIETRVRNEVTIEVAKKHFESLSKEELAQELADDPDAARMYASVQNQPPPPDAQQVDAAVQVYTRILQDQTARIASSDLPDDLKAKLNPQLHLMDSTADPDELVKNWVALIDKTIVDHRVSKEVGKAKGARSESEELERQADEDTGRPDPILTGGRRTSPLPDLMTTGSSTLLSDAFARKEAEQRRGR